MQTICSMVLFRLFNFSLGAKLQRFLTDACMWGIDFRQQIFAKGKYE